MGNKRTEQKGFDWPIKKQFRNTDVTPQQCVELIRMMVSNIFAYLT